MAKLKAELEQSKWQMFLTLAGLGYNELTREVAEQLNAQIELPMQPATTPANGEDKAAAEVPRQ